jgi:hypothetical protein
MKLQNRILWLVVVEGRKVQKKHLTSRKDEKKKKNHTLYSKSLANG